IPGGLVAAQGSFIDRISFHVRRICTCRVEARAETSLKSWLHSSPQMVAQRDTRSLASFEALLPEDLENRSLKFRISLHKRVFFRLLMLHGRLGYKKKHILFAKFKLGELSERGVLC